LTFEELIARVFEKQDSGPHLVVVNTVQTAAALADAMRKHSQDVLHLSTALAPGDREPIIERIKERLCDHSDTNWALVATSCVEAGLDFDFRTAFRELSSVTSVIQLGGRVNRGGNNESSTVLVFSLDDARASQNPDLKISMKVLEQLFESGDLERPSASEVCTKALRMELNEAFQQKLTQIPTLERKKDFPEVASKYRVIEDETITVLVPPILGAFEIGQKLSPAEMVRGSVRLRKQAIKKYALRPLAGTEELFAWTLDYDPDFLGYMDGVLKTNSVIAGEFTNA
jgi:CRISPR/Cas system-associated endonuclease/helicase Cas3